MLKKTLDNDDNNSILKRQATTVVAKKRRKDEKWRLAHNQRCRVYNKKYREKQKQEKIKIHEEVVDL